MLRLRTVIIPRIIEIVNFRPYITVEVDYLTYEERKERTHALFNDEEGTNYRKHQRRDPCNKRDFHTILPTYTNSSRFVLSPHLNLCCQACPASK